MTITQHLMRPGSGSVRFRSTLPLDVIARIRDLVDEDLGGPGAGVVITKSRLNSDVLSDTEMLSAASYHGTITSRPSRLSLEFVGLGAWLDTYLDSAVTRSSGTPAQWVGDLLDNDLTAGTVTASGLSNVSRTFAAHSVTNRQALDAWAALAGAEYRINPDLTVDVATAANLFRQAGSAGSVVVTRTAEGSDGQFRGVDGGLLDQALTQLGPSIATKAVALAEGDGAAIAKGTATRSVNLQAPGGSAPSLVTVMSAPSEESANANTAASNFLNLQGMRRAVTVSSSTHHLSRYVDPGDEVYVYDPPSGLYDPTVSILFRGQVIAPIVVRVLSVTSPIEEGVGVYIRPNESTPDYIDVTDWVEWEQGDTFWTVGDWNPPNYGPVNRTNPEIEERVAGIGVGTNITGVTAGTGWGSVTLDYCRRVGPTLFFRVTATRTGSALAAGNVTNTTVCTLTGTGATGSFASNQPLSNGDPSGLVSAVYQASTGAVTVTATATGISTSDVVSIGGSVLVDA